MQVRGAHESLAGAPSPAVRLCSYKTREGARRDTVSEQVTKCSQNMVSANA